MTTEQISLSTATIDALDDLKDDGESYNEIVAQLINERKKKRLVANVRDSMANDEFVPLEDI